MNKYEIEIPKYLKQRESNISKAKKKSKHKHHYEECLIQHPLSFAGKNNIHTQLCSYCTICGKIGGIIKNSKYRKEIETLQKQRQIGSNFWISISGEEIYKMYHDKLPVFFVDNIFTEKYVDLEQNNTSDGE